MGEGEGEGWRKNVDFCQWFVHDVQLSCFMYFSTLSIQLSAVINL